MCCFWIGSGKKNSYKRQYWQNSSYKIAINKWHYGHNLKMDYDLDNSVIWTLKFLILITSVDYIREYLCFEKIHIKVCIGKGAWCFQTTPKWFRNSMVTHGENHKAILTICESG